MKQIHIRLEESLHRDLRIQAAIKGQTLQDYVIGALKGKIAFDQASTQITTVKESGTSYETK